MVSAILKGFMFTTIRSFVFFTKTARSSSYCTNPEIYKNITDVEDFLKIVEDGLCKQFPLSQQNATCTTNCDDVNGQCVTQCTNAKAEPIRRDRFKYPVGDSLTRVWSYLKYINHETPVPKNTGFMHEPSFEYIPSLTAKPYWDPKQFRWSKILEDNHDIILRELKDVLRYRGTRDFEPDETRDDIPGWTTISLHVLGHWDPVTTSEAVDDREGTGMFPLTSRLIQDLKIPITARGVMFARQAAHSSIVPHSDPRNFVLTAHLGLDVPKSPTTGVTSELCSISVANQKRHWENGKLLIFDTSFQHQTINDAETDRYVLMIDFYHPELTVTEVRALNFYNDCLEGFFHSQGKK